MTRASSSLIGFQGMLGISVVRSSAAIVVDLFGILGARWTNAAAGTVGRLTHKGGKANTISRIMGARFLTMRERSYKYVKAKP